MPCPSVVVQIYNLAATKPIHRTSFSQNSEGLGDTSGCIFSEDLMSSLATKLVMHTDRVTFGVQVGSKKVLRSLAEAEDRLSEEYQTFYGIMPCRYFENFNQHGDFVDVSSLTQWFCFSFRDKEEGTPQPGFIWAARLRRIGSWMRWPGPRRHSRGMTWHGAPEPRVHTLGKPGMVWHSF